MNQDTLILVFYVYVGNAPVEDVLEIVRIVKQQVCPNKQEDENVKYFFIPVWNEPKTFMECLNPKMLTGEEFKKIQNKINKIEKTYRHYLEKANIGL